MAMTPYSGETEIIGKLGTTPQERGLTTQQFKDKFDEGLKAFITWFNATHKAEFDAHLADNSAHGVSHKNLLHNWYFRNPINQRGSTTYSASGYTIDRWIKGSIHTITVNSGYLSIEFGGWSPMYQAIEAPSRFAGLTVTLSADIKAYSGNSALNLWVNGTVYSPTGLDVTKTGIISKTYTLPSEISTLTVGIYGADGATVDLYAVKLELGDKSTLVNDPPPDYGEQLAICKRYYRLWTTAEARTEALKEVGLMRTSSPTTGTVSIGGNTYYYASADL